MTETLRTFPVSRRNIPALSIYRWLKHILAVYREVDPTLLTRPEVITAFNALFDRATTYGLAFQVMAPSRKHYYANGILPHPRRHLAQMAYWSLTTNEIAAALGGSVVNTPYEKGTQAMLAELDTLYDVLFALVRDVVEPYASHKDAMILQEQERKDVRSDISKLNVRRTRLEEDYKKRVKEVDDTLARLFLKSEALEAAARKEEAAMEAAKAASSPSKK